MARASFILFLIWKLNWMNHEISNQSLQKLKVMPTHHQVLCIPVIIKPCKKFPALPVCIGSTCTIWPQVIRLICVDQIIQLWHENFLTRNTNRVQTKLCWPVSPVSYLPVIIKPCKKFPASPVYVRSPRTIWPQVIRLIRVDQVIQLWHENFLTWNI